MASQEPISPVVAAVGVVLLIVLLVYLAVTNAWTDFWWAVGNASNYFPGSSDTPFTSGYGVGVLTSAVYAMSRNPAGSIIAFMVLAIAFFAIYYLAGEGSQSQEYYYE